MLGNSCASLPCRKPRPYWRLDVQASSSMRCQDKTPRQLGRVSLNRRMHSRLEELCSSTAAAAT